jgi:hypothetical protein
MLIAKNEHGGAKYDEVDRKERTSARLRPSYASSCGAGGGS